MFGIRQIDKMHQQDILLENEPFPLWGRMIPSYEKEKWSYSIVKFGRQDTGEMCFPNEKYDFDSMSRNSTFIGHMIMGNASASLSCGMDFSDIGIFMI